MQNLMVEFLYAILAVLFKLFTHEQKISYLEHQRTYLNGWARVEYSASANAGIYLQMGMRVYDAYQQALDRIVDLLKAIAQSVHVGNLYPTSEQISRAKAFGSTMALWTIEHYKCRAKYGESNVDFFSKINPLRVASRAAVYPALIPNFMEPEWALYAWYAHNAIEKKLSLPALPDQDVQIFALD
ncbi:hypothetical protein B0H14DRAFT_2803130 [Mycena olivaceomarginata]|nr:hypothetical protein B0H14DRAFT_2803130 [Mycena olivaceomarginata]